MTPSNLSQKTKDGLPLVTLGIVSYNRFLYLRALVESARECIQYPNLQWIIVDGDSVEPGLRQYIESLTFVQHKVFKKCTHPEAMNLIVDMARGEYMLLLPDDVQFIVRGRWMADLVSLVLTQPRIGHVTFNYQRRLTIARHFPGTYLRVATQSIRLPLLGRAYHVYRTAGGQEFLGYGGTREGICGSGIMSFCRTEVWRSLGPWRGSASPELRDDSSLGAETEMLQRFAASGRKLESVMMKYPVAADIVTDPRGTKARVRGGNRRYGRYLAPAHGSSYYYHIWDESDLTRFVHIEPAPSFEDVVRPIGFQLPLDAQGNLLKTSIILPDEPFELVDAQTGI